MTFDSVQALSGPLFVIFWGIVVLLWDLGSKASGRRTSVLPRFTIFGAGIGAVLSVLSATHGQGAALTYFGGGMVSDSFGALMCVIVCLIAALAALMSEQYLTEKGINQGEFYALLLFSTAGAMLMANSYDLVNVFVGLEVLSVALYILSGFARRERRSEEAAVKYFLLGAFASGFLLFGTSLVYGSVGLAVQNQPWAPAFASSSYTNFEVISAAVRLTSVAYGPSLLSSPIFVAGIGMVIVGLGFKAAIVPFHSYAPDVYEGAPTPVTAFMSVAAKVGAFGALIRIVLVLANGASGGGPFHAVLWGLAVATMIVGNVLAVRQVNIKRMLAYSSIAHAGYILVGVLAAASSNHTVSEYGQSAIHYYLFAYTFMNAGAFALVIWLGRKGDEYLSIREYDGLGKRQPLAAAVMSIFMLSLAGLPPTAGFVGKFFLFKSAILAGEGALAVVGLVVSAIGVFYYLNLIAAMYFREPGHTFEQPRAGGARIAALIAATAIVLFGLYPAASVGFAPALPQSDTSQGIRQNGATRPSTRGRRQRRRQNVGGLRDQGVEHRLPKQTLGGVHP